jgi:hypothetical protein
MAKALSLSRCEGVWQWHLACRGQNQVVATRQSAPYFNHSKVTWQRSPKSGSIRRRFPEWLFTENASQEQKGGFGPEYNQSIAVVATRAEVRGSSSRSRRSSVDWDRETSRRV